MKKYISLAAMLLAALQAAAAPIRNPTNGHYYDLKRGGGWAGLTWHEAEARARALPPINGKRPQLVTYGSYAEEEFVIRNLGTNVNRCWIGLFRLNQNSSIYGNWAWIDGTRFSYANWHSGEPNNGGGNREWYGLYWYEGSIIRTAGWGDISGNFRADGFVVEYK